MTGALHVLSFAARIFARGVLLMLPVWFASCSSTPKIAGIPSKLPDIALSGPTATPTHQMASYEYPFDTGGNYVPDWAAEGERRAGRSPVATSDDENRWSGSHGGRSSGVTKFTATKPKTVAGKSKAAADNDPPKKKSGTSSGSKSKGPKYMVKKGDTVEKIASKLGVSVKALRAANDLKTDTILVNKKLKVPAHSAAGSAPAPASSAAPSGTLPAAQQPEPSAIPATPRN